MSGMTALLLSLKHYRRLVNLCSTSMALGLSIAFGCLALLSASSVAAAEETTLQAGLNETLYLPQGMYGQWQVQATLLDTDSPEVYPKYSNDLWILQRVGSVVYLSNPATGAMTHITVESVEGNSASFTHEVASKRGRIVERPRVTLQNNQLLGYTLVERQWNGLLSETVAKVAKARYRLEAYRLGNAPMSSFSNGLTPKEPDIQIDPLQ
jgi:hypothetical protein